MDKATYVFNKLALSDNEIAALGSIFGGLGGYVSGNDDNKLEHTLAGATLGAMPGLANKFREMSPKQLVDIEKRLKFPSLAVELERHKL